MVPLSLAAFTAKHKKALTIKWRDLSEKNHTLRMYHRDPDGDAVWVPRHYGLRIPGYRLPNSVMFEDGCKFIEGIPPIKLKGYQVPWVEEVVSLFRGGEHDVVAEAGVGKGKTVMSLEIARRLNRQPLILVDQEMLMDQWVERAMQFYGVERDEIGIVRGDVCEFEDKACVIGMIQSLYRREYLYEFYEQFGLVILDEVHTVGAPVFSTVLGMFNMAKRLGVSATPNRPDALNKVLKAHLGPVQVSLANRHKASQVRVVEYDGMSAGWYATITKKEGRFISEMSEDTDRNLLLTEMIYKLYETGRDVLVISGRIEQLQALREMVILRGAPREECGLVTGQENFWRYIKDASPSYLPIGWDREAEYTPVKLVVVQKTVKKEVREVRKNNSRIIFTTYGIFNKGVDVPRLSAGVDATPRSRSQQVHGRILRPRPGKLIPVWATVRDKMSYRCEFQLMNRLADYDENNAEVSIWQLDKGLKRKETREFRKYLKQRVEKLQQAQILTRKDGHNIVTIPGTGIQLNSARSKPIERTDRKRRARSSPVSS